MKIESAITIRDAHLEYWKSRKNEVIEMIMDEIKNGARSDVLELYVGELRKAEFKIEKNKEIIVLLRNLDQP